MFGKPQCSFILFHVVKLESWAYTRRLQFESFARLVDTLYLQLCVTGAGVTKVVGWR
jgi:hypothetical protein